MFVPTSILSNLPKVAAREQSRYSLASIRMEHVAGFEDRYRAVATDSRRLIAATFKSECNGLANNVLISSKMAVDLAKDARKAKAKGVMIVDGAVKGESAVASFGGSAEQSRTFHLEEGRFPKWDECVPNARRVISRSSNLKLNDVYAMVARFRAKDLAETILAVAAANESEAVWIELSMDERRPMRIMDEKADGTGAVGIVMPSCFEQCREPFERVKFPADAVGQVSKDSDDLALRSRALVHANDSTPEKWPNELGWNVNTLDTVFDDPLRPTIGVCLFPCAQVRIVLEVPRVDLPADSFEDGAETRRTRLTVSGIRRLVLDCAIRGTIDRNYA